MTLADRCPSVPNLSKTPIAAATIPRKRVTLEQSYSSPGYATTKSQGNYRRYNRANTSILLTRWLSSKKKKPVDLEASTEVKNWDPEDCCMDYGKPPPVEEPHCYSMCMSESSISDEENDELLIVNNDIINGLLTENMRQIGGKIQLIDDLKSNNNDDDDDENIFIKSLETCKLKEINVLLLYVSFIGKDKFIPCLHKAGADLNYTENERGLTALHLCAYSNSLMGIKYLLLNGATINYSKIHTPFHYAAFGNSINVAKYFFDIGMSQDSQQYEETVLHAAAKSNSIDILKLLVESKNNLSINKIDSFGYGPIHYVADCNNSICLKIIIDAGANINLKNKKGDTALHIAADAGCFNNIELLLNNNNTNIKLKNNRGQTALHLASRSHSYECVELLLRYDIKNNNSNDIDNDGRTPLHLTLGGRSLLTYNLTELLINNNSDVNISDKYGYTPLHVAALNELSQCVDILIKYGADLSAKTKGGTTALSIILRKTPTSLCIFKERLDSSITLDQQNSTVGEMELRLDFNPLLQNRGQGEIGYLGTFVEEGYKEILEHPLCQSFLHLKWQKIRKYYVGRLFFYLLYVIVLTSWVMTALAHNCYNESHGQIDNLINNNNNNNNNSFNNNNHHHHHQQQQQQHLLCANSTGLKGFFHRHPQVLEIEWYILVLLTIFEGIRKATGILTYSSIRQFITQPENIVEWCVILSVFGTSFIYTGRTYTWQSHLGAFAVLCGWSNLMLMIGQLPMFGAYVAMFTSVQAQVFKLLLAYACLLFGFTASFCVIFPRSKSFSSPHTGLIKVLVMMTGELDFEELFFPGDEDEINYDDNGNVISNVDVGSTSWILLQVSAQLSFVLFLLFVTIVLMNLLVGIAVHDIKGLQKTAGLAKLVRQTKLICDVESALLLALLPHKLIKLLSWTTLVLPSPLRAVLIVRPLNPREKRLPRDVLVAAHRVAKNKKFIYLKKTLSPSPSSLSSSTTATTSSLSSSTSSPLTISKQNNKNNNNCNSKFIHRRKSEPPPPSFNYCHHHDKKINFNYENNFKADSKLQDKIIELTDICESNRKLIENLVTILATDERFNLQKK